MIQVLHLITDLNVGGAETMLHKLVSHSDRKRFKHHVVSMLDKGVLGDRIQAAGVQVHVLGMRRGRPSFRGSLALRSILRETRPDILQTWMYHADLLGTLAVVGMKNTVLLWNLRNSSLDTSQYRRLSRWTMRACAFLSRHPRIVVSNSEAACHDHMRLGYKPRRWVVIPNGFDISEFAPEPSARLSVRNELRLASETILIGLIARYDPQKDHVTFLQAAAQLAQAEPRVHFLLAGEGATLENPSLAALIQKLNMADRLHLLGCRLDVARLDTALDLATSASAFGEGFSNVVGEAMACGVPCVVTDVGESAQIVGDTGRVVPPRDPASMQNAWKELLALDENARRSLGQRARQRIEQNYSLVHIVHEYEMLYTSLLNEQ